MADEVTFRRYRESDKEAIVILHVTAFEARGIQLINASQPIFSDIEKSYFQKDGYFYVAEYEDRIVGMGGLRRFNDDTGELKSLRVHPEFKGQGIGKKLLLALEEKARELNYKSLILDTMMPQTKAQKLYEGYTVFKTDTQNGSPVLYYQKILPELNSYSVPYPV